MKNFILLLLFFALPSGIYGQTRELSGIVRDENGEPLIGVTVRVKDQTLGTITDVNGRFSFQIPQSTDYLLVSYIGYKTASIQVRGLAEVNISMEPDFTHLEEVVVTGYASQKKVNLTGAIENINVEDLDTRSLTNTGLAIQGKVSGVLVTQNSGQPGQDMPEIRIRGVSSIENSNDPLVIIDGMEGSLEDVHPQNIESMTVLKDASSAAIYGNRAAAGVIIIKTKEGSGKLHITLSANSSIQEPTALPKSVDAYTFATLLNEARLNSGFPNVPYDEESLAAIKEGSDLRLQTLDLYDLYFGPALMQNYYATLSGGERNYNYSFSVGYLNQDGVLLGTRSDKFMYRAKLGSKLWNDRLKLGLSFSGYQKDDSELTSSTETVMTSLATSSPIGFVQVSDSISGGEDLYSMKVKYLAMDEAGGGIKRLRNQFNYMLDAEVSLLKGLTARILYGQTILDYNYTRFVPSVSLAGNPYEDQVSSITQSELQKVVSTTFSGTFNTTVNYNLKLNNQEINLLAGYEFLNYSYNEDGMEIKDLLYNSPSFSFGDPETRFIYSSIRKRATMSYFGRINYSILDRYLFEANLRRDGSSRFSEENRWGTFPSFSAGWRISEEEFMQNLDFMYLKIRASWGRLGNERISLYYPAFDVLEAGQYYSFGGKVYQGTATTLLANKDITWEVTEQINLGLDAVLFKTYSVGINLFRKNTYDILGKIDIPLSLGLGTSPDAKPYQNIGSMRNEGVEMSFNYENKWKNSTFDAGFNITYLSNTILDLGGLEFVSHDVISGYQPPADIIRSQVGFPFGSYFGLVAEGIYQVDDFTWQNDSDPTIAHHDRIYKLKPELPDPSAIFRNPVPGDIKFSDISGPDGEKDMLITNDDITFMGSSQPKMIFALNLSATVRKFYFNILAQGTQGGSAYIMGAMVTPFWNGGGNISQEMASNRWTIENPSESYQQLYDDSQRANIVSTYYLQDASYLRIKNIEAGYRISSALLKTKGIEELRISLSLENAFTFTGLKGFDPEKSFNKITADFHPQIRIYSLGVQIKL